MVTIGYGDFVPVTTGGKVLTMMFAVMGVPLFVYTSSMIIDFRLRRYMDNYAKLVGKNISVPQKSWLNSFFSRGNNNEPATQDDKTEEQKEETTL